jgi:threonine dehydrogenase-like Zn-dependent dehydrogenase
MKAVCWHGTKDMRVREVPDPKVVNPRDAVIRVTSTAICGSDLHFYNGYVSGMRAGDVVGHEFMGEVVAAGSGVKNLREGDRVVVPCVIACGACFFCKRALFSCCDNSNPNPLPTEEAAGYPNSGIFGYTHAAGGYAGGQAELARVPYADFGPIKVPAGVPDERVLFLSDILPTAWMAAENCNVRPGDTVAVWGCGPVGQLAIRCLTLMGAERVFAIDRVSERLSMAAAAGAVPINFENRDVYEELHDQTGGLGPDACLDAVGMEAHGTGAAGVIDRVKQAVGVQTDRPSVLREIIRCCRKGGTLSIVGVYSGLADSIPMGASFSKGLTWRMSQVHLHRYKRELVDLVMEGRLDPSAIITHVMALDQAPRAYAMFSEKTDGTIKVVLKPGAASANGSGAEAQARAQGPGGPRNGPAVRIEDGTGLRDATPPALT